MRSNQYSQKHQRLMRSSLGMAGGFGSTTPCPYGGGRRRLVIGLLGGLLGLALIPGTALAAGKVELKDETGKINYSVGYQIGGDFKKQGIAVDPEALVQGVRDAINQSTPLLSQERMNAVLVEMKRKIEAGKKSAAARKAAEYSAASAVFLKENAKREGVKVLADGVQYKVLREGTGRKPTLKDEVKVNYRISRVGGKEIGNTYDTGTPRTFALAKALPGLQEVLPLMAVGSKWQIVLPTGIAAGGHDPMDDQGVILYEMELLSVIPGK